MSPAKPATDPCTGSMAAIGRTRQSSQRADIVRFGRKPTCRWQAKTPWHSCSLVFPKGQFGRDRRHKSADCHVLLHPTIRACLGALGSARVAGEKSAPVIPARSFGRVAGPPAEKKVSRPPPQHAKRRASRPRRCFPRQQLERRPRRAVVLRPAKIARQRFLELPDRRAGGPPDRFEVDVGAPPAAAALHAQKPEAGVDRGAQRGRGLRRPALLRLKIPGSAVVAVTGEATLAEVN